MSIKTISTYESIVKGTNKSKKSLLFDFKKTYSAYIVLILIVIASVFVMEFVKKSIESDQKLAFEKASNSILSRIDKHNQNIMHVQKSMKNLFERTFVVKGVFELNSLNLVKTYDALVGINYVYQVFPAQMPEFIHSIRSQGYYDIKIHPEAKRDVYYIVEYVVPFEGNEERSGFDYASDSIAMKYIIESAELDSTLVTPVYNFKKGVTGFQIITAVYKKGESRQTLDQGIEHNQGTLILEVDSQRFFEEALGKGNASDSTVYFSVYDTDNNNQQIYKSKYYVDKANYKPAVSETTTIQLANKNFEIRLATVPNFGGNLQDILPFIALIITLVIGVMLFAFLISVITSRERAQEIADRLTLSQRRIFDTSNDIIGILDLSGVWKTVNNAVSVILGVESDKMIDTNIANYYRNELAKNELIETIQKAGDDTAFNQTALMKTDGNDKWVDWNLSISKSDGLIYAIGRDVTLEKEAETLGIIKSRQRNLAEHYAKEANISKSFLVREISDKLLNLLGENQKSLQQINSLHLDLKPEEESIITDFEENSNVIYNIVDSMKENTEMSDKEHNYRIEKVNFLNKLGIAIKNVKTQFASNNVTVNTDWNNLSDLYIYATESTLNDTFNMLFKILIANQKDVEINIQISKNNFENVMELEILCSNNTKLTEYVNKFKSNRNNIFDIISGSNEDFIYNIALVESDFKRMNGNITIESLEEDETLMIITLPLNI